MIVFLQSGSIRQKWLSPGKLVVGQKWLYSCKSGCIQAKVVVFGQSGCIRAKWLYSGKSDCIMARVDVLGRSGFNRAKVVVFGQK